VFNGDERLVRELKNCGGKPLQTACAQVIQSLLRFGGKEQPDDDITLMVIEFRDRSPEADDRLPDSNQCGIPPSYSHHTTG